MSKGKPKYRWYDEDDYDTRDQKLERERDRRNSKKNKKASHDAQFENDKYDNEEYK